MVIEGRCTAREGAWLVQLSERQVLRLKKGLREQGPAALAHGNRGRRPRHAIADQLRKEVIELATSLYRDYNHTHLQEKLEERHSISLSRRSVTRILTVAGLRSPRKRRARKHRSRRPRMPQEGMLLQVDGSNHDWLEGRGPKLVLVGAVDDATGDPVHAVFREHEDAAGYFLLLRDSIRRKGVPLAWYSDRHGIFQHNGKEPWTLAEELAGRRQPTQVARALEELGINLILANSPQAKGRVERLWETFQDRLAKSSAALTPALSPTLTGCSRPSCHASASASPASQPSPGPPTGRCLRAQTWQPSAASTTSAASPTTTQSAWWNASFRSRPDLAAAAMQAAVSSYRNGWTAHSLSSIRAVSSPATRLSRPPRCAPAARGVAATPQTTSNHPRPPRPKRTLPIVPNKSPLPRTPGVP